MVNSQAHLENTYHTDKLHQSLVLQENNLSMVKQIET